MKPPVFRELSFEAAQQAARSEKKWLLVDFTAEWCAPCKNMDATTWRDPSVEKWLNANTVPIQIDVDHDPAAQRFAVRSMPTVLILDGDTEVDRTSGARPADKLLSWLSDLRAGRTELDSLRLEAKGDLQARFNLSRVLHSKGLADEATTEAVWLWDHALETEPAWLGVRLSFLIAHFKELLPSSTLAKTDCSRLPGNLFSI